MSVFVLLADVPLVVLDPGWMTLLVSSVCTSRPEVRALLPPSVSRHGLVVDSHKFFELLWGRFPSFRAMNHAAMFQLLTNMGVHVPIPGSTVSIVPNMFAHRGVYENNVDFWLGRALGTQTEVGNAVMMLLSWAGQRAVVMHDSEEMRVWCRVRGSQPRLLRFILMHMLHEILHLHVPCLDTSKVEVGVSCHACGAPSSPFLGVAKKKAAAGKSYQCFMCDQVLDVQDLVDPPVEWKTMARQFFAGMGPSRPLPPAAASASASTHVPLH
jgi:hypothetical protein